MKLKRRKINDSENGLCEVKLDKHGPFYDLVPIKDNFVLKAESQ